MTELVPLQPVQQRRKLTAADFEMLDRGHAFDAYSKTELLDGDIYVMNSQQRPHGRMKMELFLALRERLLGIGSIYTPMVEVGLALSEHSTPEPDLLLTSEPEGTGWVPLASVAIVIEVSDTTLTMDLGRKMALYAQAGVPEYWVVDVNARVTHQMWSPEGAGYSQHRQVSLGELLSAATLPGLTIATVSL